MTGEPLTAAAAFTATIPDLATISDSGTGPAQSDNITNVETPFFNVVIPAEMEAGDTVELIIGATTLVTHTITVDDVGTTIQLQVASSLGDAVYNVATVLTDNAGMLGSDTSGTLSVTIDNFVLEPGAPTLVTDTGISGTDGITKNATNDFTVALGSGSRIGDVIELLNGAAVIGTHTVTVDNQASATFTGITLAEGSHSLSARATDVATNTVTSAAPSTIVIDTIAVTPAATVTVPGVEVAVDGQSVVLSGIAGDVARGTVTLTDADSNTATITFLAADVSGGSVSFDETDISWSPAGPVSGTVTVDVTVEDTAGNETPSGSQTFELDVAADEAGDALAVAFAETDGFLNIADAAAGQVINVTGIDDDVLAAGVVVTVSDGTTSITVSPASITGGAASVTLTSMEINSFANGSLTLSVEVTDNVGNTASATGAPITLDTEVPTVTITPDTARDIVNSTEEGRVNFVPVPGHWGTLPLSVKGAPNGTTATEVHR